MNKKRLILSGILIILLSWLDYQYFTEAPYAYIFSDNERRTAHIICLSLMTAIGYAGWYLHPMQWLRKIWILLYCTVAGIMLATGAIQALTHILPQNILNSVSAIRMFFCTPVPFFMLYVLSYMAVKGMKTV